MTSRRKAVYLFIAQYQEEHGGMPPTIREIMDATGIKSTASVFRIIERLAYDGLVIKERGIARIANGVWTTPETYS